MLISCIKLDHALYSINYNNTNSTCIYYRLLVTHTTQGLYFIIYIYSLSHNNISDAGAQALAEGLQHCSNLQMLEWVLTEVWHV